MKKLLLFFGFSFIVSFAIAQERTVSGKVTSVEDGTSLPGVNVILKGTTNGTVTDIDGNYKLNVPSDGGTLVFSFIGLATEEVEIGSRSVIDLQMSSDVQQLSEVVVTAVGIEREKKALGYSVATVDAEQMQQKSEPDPLRAMQGKMPGVNITGGGGAPGQGTKINIRGMSSITGNTQPLFIVDGIPFDNSVNASSGADENSVFSNRAFDLDPNNIESISVLKGAAASALYGSRATNGVIVITTKAAKKGVRKGLEITYNGSVNFEEISGIPDYQDVYTQGSNQVYNGGFIGNWGAPFPNHVDRLNAQYGTNYTKSYGVYPDGTPYPEGTAPNPINNRFPGLFPEFVQDYNGTDVSAPYEIKPNDIIGGYFDTGVVTEHAVSISSGSEKASINGGFSRMNNESYIPNAESTRTTINFGGNGQLDNGLFLSGTINYSNTFQQAPQSGGSAFNDYFAGPGNNFNGGGSIFARLFYLPRNFDLNGLPFENPVDGSNVFYRALDNPRWIAKYNLYTSDVNRAYGSLTASYDITDWLTVLARGGMNTYHDSRRSVVRSGGIQWPNGFVWTEDISFLEQYYDFTATINKDINSDLNINALFGLNLQERELTRRKVTGNNIISDGIDDKGLYRTDATSTQIVDYDFSSLRRLYALYSSITVGYKDFAYLTLTGRNDWSSTLPQGNNSYFYPSASLSTIISEIVDLPAFWSFAKVRLAWAKVGNDADPYNTGIVYSIGTPFTPSGGSPINRASLGNRLGNSDLKPEFTTEYEVGLESQFVDNRIGLDVTYFNRTSTDLILFSELPRSSGYTEEVVNLGELNNSGWEIGLDLTPLRLSNGFTWNSYFAFTKFKTEVINAGPSGEVLLGGPSSTLGTIFRDGAPYGQIFGSENARDDEGNLLIDPNTGLPFALPTSDIIGDPNPDFTLGWTNSFSFKGITLRALVDWRQGGDFYSFTAASLLLRGQLKISEDREGLRVVPGVLGNTQTFEPILDENNNKIQNTVAITAFDSHFSNGWGAYGQDEVNIYDGTVIRLREISLGYSVPKSILAKTPFGSASISISGRNLWYNAPNLLEGLNLDPEVLGETPDSNVQGFEYGTAPTTKRYGVNLSLTF
ncbi:MAG: SusC/RagA family TonB-linked outer membrane protein [Fulvivirga sp.]